MAVANASGTLTSSVAWKRLRTLFSASTLALLIVVVAATSAGAHRVGGDEGSGTIEWEPFIPAPRRLVTLTLNDVELTSGEEIIDADLFVVKGDDHVSVDLVRRGGGYAGSFRIPRPGRWELQTELRTAQRQLLSITLIDVDAERGSRRSHSEPFTLALLSPPNEPAPAWVVALTSAAFLIATLVIYLRVRAALRRLPVESRRSPAAEISLWVVAFLATAAVLWLSLQSSETGPLSDAPDKVIHFGGYALLTLSLLLAADWSPRWGSGAFPGSAVRIAITVFVVSGALELLQAAVPGRDTEIYDAVANALGAALALVIWRVMRAAPART